MALEAVQEKIFNNMQKLADEYIAKKNKKKKENHVNNGRAFGIKMGNKK